MLLTADGPLDPLLDYCLHHLHDRSLSWMRKLIHSVSLLLDYIEANPGNVEPWRLFRNFAQRLYTGTYDLKLGLDPSNLCWAPKGWRSAAYSITLLSEFFDWLGESNPSVNGINPKYAGTAYDRRLDEVAYCYRRNKAFLGHTWAENPGAMVGVRVTRGKSLPQVTKREPPEFPHNRFEELIFKGFRVRGKHDYRGMLITLLLHGAGFRESEPFHLYISDVFPDPANPRQAKVLIHHPSHGAAPADWRDSSGKPRKGNRAEYLAQQFGLAPRTKVMTGRRAGWKGGMHDAAYYKQAYWFLPEYGEWFLHLWHLYLEQVARVERDHPFAFINLGREPVGAMYKLDQYNKAHAAACERIGLMVGKELGTTPHGHRHAYGRRLSNAGVDKPLIRRFMHHASVESQEVYTQATTRETLVALDAAARRLRGQYSDTPSVLGRLMLDNELDN